MNKTTSFSKISASKNNSKCVNSNDTIQIDNTNQIDNKFKNYFMETINDQNDYNTNEKTKNKQFDDIVSKKSLKDKILSKKQPLNKYKTWCSESNLTNLENNLLVESSRNNNAEFDTQNEKIDYDCYELEGDLQFSDHAGLFDEFNNSKITNINDHIYADELEESKLSTNSQKQLDNYKNNILSNKYDFYKLTKKNYKLTYNHNNTQNDKFWNMLDNNLNISQKINDSLFSTGHDIDKNHTIYMNKNKNNLNDEDFEDEDNIDNEDLEEKNYTNLGKNNISDSIDEIRNIKLKSELYNKMNETELMKLLNNNENFFNEDFANANFEESIMNWSMKLSNCQQQSLHKRSHSRSPPPRSNSTSQFNLKNSQYFNKTQETSNFPIEFLNTNNTKEQQKFKGKTSWGKLKHSKSSCSNISSSINNSNENNNFNQSLLINNKEESVNLFDSYGNTDQFNYNINVSNEKNNNIKNFNNTDTVNNLPSKSSPSLFKLFQDSKANMNTQVNFDSFTNRIKNDFLMSSQFSEKSNHNNRLNEFKNISQLKNDNNHKNNQGNIRHKTTSFSQLKERSQSSHAIGDGHHRSNNFMKYDDDDDNDDEDYNEKNEPYFNQNDSFNKKSIGIQHQPSNFVQAPTIVCMVVNRNHRTTTKDLMAAAKAARAVAAKRSNSLFYTKTSLPDLTFLKDYADDKNKPISTTKHRPKTQNDESDEKNLLNNSKPINQSSSNGGSIGSDLLKRKTLKSIKRYRQTKQNTEPCVMENISIESQTNIYNQYYHQEQFNANYYDYDQAQTVIYSNKMFIKNYADTESPESSSFNSNAKKEKQPLKSCLKRKESQPIDIRNYNKESQNDQKSSKQDINNNSRLVYNSKPKPAEINSTSLILSNRNNFKEKKSMHLLNHSNDFNYMFVPFIGYLFISDQKSCTRYRYYNNLEKNRRINIFNQLTNNKKVNSCKISKNEIQTTKNKLFCDENDFYDDTDEENICIDNKKSNNKRHFINSSKSESDLRVKKSVTFLSNVINQLNASVSPIQNINDIDFNKIDSSHHQKDKKTAPPLQYNNLIALLKSNSSVKSNKNPSKNIDDEKNDESSQEQFFKYKNSPQLVKKISSSAKDNKKNKIKQMVNTQSNMKYQTTNNEKYNKNYQVIEADSISLASLSESPPSEFKFSDEEGENDSAFKKNINNYIDSKIFRNIEKELENNNNSIKISNFEMTESNKSNNKLQQLKMNQMIELKRKKNFHAILLKDTKLNNLKEILVEIKQQQQKLNNLILKSDPKNESTNSSTATSTSSSSSTNVGMASTPNQANPINKLNTNNNNVLIEFKEVIDRLSQYLFEFLKQGLKPIPIDSIMNSVNQNTNASISKSPPASPISFGRHQQVLESNTLTTTFSQYTQIWNLIEHTMNLNFVNENNQIFFLPKDAYLAMFQEINRYANSINHTYLIDSGINTSQLRRKHHFMVLLIGLKFKFQLFIVNLLSHRELANWFEFLNKEHNLLKIYYDLKPVVDNSLNNGDSGLSEYIYASTSSSFSSSFNGLDLKNNDVSNINSITNLSNVSIFENEDYFNYFHKLLQQFNIMDFNMNLLREISPIKQEISTIIKNNESSEKIIDNEINVINNQSIVTNSSKNHSKKPIAPLRKLSAKRSSNSIDKNNTIQNSITSNISNIPNITQSMNQKNNNINQAYHTGNNAGSSAFNFKNISKKFNIKSWFTSSNSHLSHHSKSSVNSNNTNNSYFKSSIMSPIKAFDGVNESHQAYDKYSNKKTYKNIIGGLNILNKRVTESTMKHSLSEPSINALIQ